MAYFDLVGSGFPDWIEVLILAASPISELRGAIPWAILHHDFPWYLAFLLAVTGNLLPVPFLLLFLDGASRLLRKIAWCRQFIDWLFERTRRRGEIITKYERIGLVLFVAVPLPVTGAWTGALTAVIFGLKFKHALWSIFAGILIAGTIVTCLSLIGWVGAVIAGVALSSLITLGLWRF
ncbi:COG2426 family protein [Chloroflexota bacterium]